MRHLISFIVLSILTVSMALGQEEPTKEAKVVIRTENGTRTVEDWGDELGNLISASIMKAFNIEGEDKNLDINVETDWDELEEGFENIARQFTEGLEIEMQGLTPDDFEGDSFNGYTMQDWFDEIGQRQESPVSKISHFVIRLRGEEGVELKMDAELENGRKIHEERFLKD